MENTPPIYALAVDVGGTKMDIAFIDQHGNFLEPPERALVPFDENGVAVPYKILDILEPYVNRGKKKIENFAGIGLSLCGNIDRETGESVLVANLYWRNVPFGKMAEDRFGVKNYPATDVFMALLAEVKWGKAKGLNHVAWMTLGTGYGGYLYLDGKMYHGAHGFAGNLGHSIYDEREGELCGCGQKGCFESYVAGPAIASQGEKACAEGWSPVLKELCSGNCDEVTTRMVFEAERKGDHAAHEIIESVIRKLGISLSGMVDLLDLEMIVLGGGVWRGSPDFVERVDRRVRGFLMTDEAKRDLQIVLESFDNSALKGAGAYVFQQKGLL